MAGTGHVRKRGPASWEVRFTLPRGEDGKRQTRTITVRGKKLDAEKRLVELLRERDTGSTVDPSRTTVGQWLDEWLGMIRVAPKTKERYAGLITHQIKPHLGATALQDLQAAAIERWHATLREKGYVKNGKVRGLSDRTVLHAHRCLATAMARAKKLKLIVTNPILDTDQPKVKVKKAMQTLKKGEPRAVLEALAGHDLYPITHLALASGMRRGELLGLAWSAVDLDRGAVKVVRSLEQTKDGLRFKEPKSDAGTRTITIPAATAQALREHKVKQLELRMQLGLGKLPDDALVFPDVDGEPMDPDKLSKAWKRAVKKLGLPKLGFHELRHSHASALISAGQDIVMVSKRLGHANPNVTLGTYAHLFEQDDSAAAVAIAAVLG